MNLKAIQKITDKEYDSNLTDYENTVKLFERLDKELKGIDRIFLRILKNDIKELEPIDDYIEDLVRQLKECKEQKKNNQKIYMTTLTILYLIFANDTTTLNNKLITPFMMKKILYMRALKNKIWDYLSKSLQKNFQSSAVKVEVY